MKIAVYFSHNPALILWLAGKEENADDKQPTKPGKEKKKEKKKKDKVKKGKEKREKGKSAKDQKLDRDGIILCVHASKEYT